MARTKRAWNAEKFSFVRLLAREREKRASRRYEVSGGKKRNEISKYLYSPCASKHRKNINHKLYVNHKSEARCRGGEEEERKKCGNVLGRVEKQNEKAAARAEKGILSSVAAAGVMGDGEEV
jgi:hypothetical protein